MNKNRLSTRERKKEMMRKDITAPSDHGEQAYKDDYTDELIDDGDGTLFTITKDTTEEEIEQIIHDMAERITPPKDDPIWTALSHKIYVEMSPRNRCIVSLGNREAVQKFEDELAEHIANGGDEDEFCLAYIDEVQRNWECDGMSWEEEARRYARNGK